MINKHTLISLLHIFFIGPAILYLGITKGKIPNIAFHFVLISGISVFLYHAFKAYMVGFKYGWIYALHAILFAPLLILLGYMKNKTPNAVYTLLTMVGGMAILYHLFLLLR